MKKTLLLFSLITCACSLFAQEPADALRYSWYIPGGTAREQAIGGAMGSLGGDLTATFINPAGLALYKTGDFVFTPRFSFGKTKATYQDMQQQQSSNKFTWGTTGFVLGNGGGRGNVRNSSFSIAYNRMADFNSHIVYRGTNNQTSYSQKYLEEIRNGNIKDANSVANDFPFGSSLAFNTFWIDTVGGGSSGNYNFQTRAPIATGLLQQNTIESSGGIDEIALGLSMNLKDKFLIGGSFGVPILHYKRTTEFLEADGTPNTDNKFNYAQLQDNLSTTGVGLNLKLGVIYKPDDIWRIGLAFHTPTIYSLTDKYTSTITTDTENYMGVLTQSSEDLNNGTSEFKYNLTTPYRVIGSLSYVIRETEDISKQRGFITADFEYVNYKASSFSVDNQNGNSSDKDYFNQLNNTIDQAYKGAFNFRVGGELKFTTLMFRAGAAYYSNPYKNIQGEKGSKLNLSGGLGYRNNGFFIDLTYIYALHKDVNFPYRLQYAPSPVASLKTGRSNVLLTVGFKI